MKVTYKEINGILIISDSTIIFRPDVEPYGPNSVIFFDANISHLGGKIDEYVITVDGYISLTDKTYKKVVMESFYPRFEEMLKE